MDGMTGLNRKEHLMLFFVVAQRAAVQAALRNRMERRLRFDRARPPRRRETTPPRAPAIKSRETGVPASSTEYWIG